MEQNPKNIILHCSTNDTNDDSDPQNIAKEILELAKSITKDLSSNVTVSDGEICQSAEIWTYVLLAMRISSQSFRYTNFNC